MKRHLTIIALFAICFAPTWAASYPESVKQEGQQERNIAYGWNFDFYGGLGVSSYRFSQIGDNFTPAHVDPHVAFPAWNAGLSINYYFVPWMGIGAGAEFASYANDAAVVRGWTDTRTDYQGQTYTLTAVPYNLTERQTIGMLEIPVALKFRARPSKVGFTGALGVKLGLPMLNSYSMGNQGRLDNQVYYEHWDLLIQDIPTVLEDIPVIGKSGQLGTGALNVLNYAGYAELGVLVQLHQRVDLAISLFGNYYINNLLANANTLNLSYADSYTVGEYPAPFTGTHTGILETTEVRELHPWSAGVKIGIQINANRTRAEREYDNERARERKAAQKAKRERERRKKGKDQPAIEEPTPEVVVPEEEPETIPDPEEERARRREEAIGQIRQLAEEHEIDLCSLMCEDSIVVVHDTVIIREQVIVRDTIQESVPEPQPTAAEQLDEVLKAAVIYFNINDTVPILEPQDILIRIADILRRHPDQKVHVNGHACKLGTPALNKVLSKNRAKAVAARLRALGVREDQMLIKSLGADHPYRYTGEHQLSKDRRVEIIPYGEEAVQEQAPSANGTLQTSETVQPGSRLAPVARRHYGEPQYWIFIYEANLDKIANPNDLPVGVELVIPDLSKRLAGMNKEQALQEAERVKARLLKD